MTPAKKKRTEQRRNLVAVRFTDAEIARLKKALGTVPIAVYCRVAILERLEKAEKK